MDPRNNIDPQAQAKLEATLKEEHNMVFTKGELLAIFNILTKIQINFGDYKVIAPIIEKIHPIVAVDSNIPTEPPVTGIRRGES